MTQFTLSLPLLALIAIFANVFVRSGPGVLLLESACPSAIAQARRHARAQEAPHAKERSLARLSASKPRRK